MEEAKGSSAGEGEGAGEGGGAEVEEVEEVEEAAQSSEGGRTDHPSRQLQSVHSHRWLLSLPLSRWKQRARQRLQPIWSG